MRRPGDEHVPVASEDGPGGVGWGVGPPRRAGDVTRRGLSMHRSDTRHTGTGHHRPACGLVAAAMLLAAVAALPGCRSDGPATFEATCVGVDDGDSLRVILGTTERRVRLHGIDSPEKGQPFADEAKRRTSDLVLGRRITLRVEDTDRYGRLVARVWVGDVDVNRELVASGLAWHYRRYSDDPALAEAERRAREGRRGLWSLEQPEAPWDYRRRRPRRHGG